MPSCDMAIQHKLTAIHSDRYLLSSCLKPNKSGKIPVAKQFWPAASFCRTVSKIFVACMAQSAKYLDYRLNGRSVVRIPTGIRDFSVHQTVQAGSGAHPANYSTGTEVFIGVTRPGHDVTRLRIGSAIYLPTSTPSQCGQGPFYVCLLSLKSLKCTKKATGALKVSLINSDAGTVRSAKS
jgi:hypothetical protein